AGHPDVHQHDVGEKPPCEPHRLGTVRRLPDDLESFFGIQQGTEPSPHQGLVVGEQHPDHGSASTSVGSGRGSRADTWTPPPGRAPVCSSPPSAARRSRMPAMPLPPPAGSPTGIPLPSSSTLRRRSPAP